MTNNLQDRFDEDESRLRNEILRIFFGEELGREEIVTALTKFMRSEVEQAKKDLINQFLKEAPEDRDYSYQDYTIDPMEINGFNEANKQWKELLTKHI